MAQKRFKRNFTAQPLALAREKPRARTGQGACATRRNAHAKQNCEEKVDLPEKKVPVLEQTWATFFSKASILSHGTTNCLQCALKNIFQNQHAGSATLLPLLFYHIFHLGFLAFPSDRGHQNHLRVPKFRLLCF